MTLVTPRRLGATILLGLPCAAFLAVGASIGARTNYFPALNDFWPLLFQSNTLSVNDPETFKNGFFPPGYAVFLHLIGGDAVLARAFWANLLFTAATTLATYGVVRLFASAAAAIAAATLTAFHPLIFSIGLTTGPDAGCVLFTAGGFFLLVAGAQASREAARHAAWTAGGLLFGVAALWRYHGLVFGVAAVVSALLVYRDRGVLRASGGLVVALILLASLSLFPGLSPQLARAQAFNVWKASHPVNWYHMPTDFPPSIAGVIRAEPTEFWQVYWTFNRSMVWVLGAPLIGAIVLPAPARRAPQAALLLTLGYLPIVNMGMSLRGLGPIIPITLACLALVIDRLVTGITSPRLVRVGLAAFAAAAILFFARPWVETNRAFVAVSIAGYEWRRAVELELRAQGVTSPLQVYGDAGFHFVTPRAAGWYAYIPHFNGGWPRLDLYGLDRLMPELATSTLDAFILDCERRGITHVVLSGTAGYLLPALGEIYDGRLADPRLQPASAVAGMRIFRLGP